MTQKQADGHPEILLRKMEASTFMASWEITRPIGLMFWVLKLSLIVLDVKKVE
jgi:hypothetical protein